MWAFIEELVATVIYGIFVANEYKNAESKQ